MRTGCVCAEIRDHELAVAYAHAGRHETEAYLMPAEGSPD